MSLNFNQCTLAGRLTADPELKITQNGQHFTKFNIAIDRPKYKDRESVADFLTIVAWSEKADFVTNYFKKGSPILVVCTAQSNSYEDKDGKKRTSIEFKADSVQFVESKSSSGSSAPAPAAKKPTVTTAMDIAEGGEADDCPF